MVQGFTLCKSLERRPGARCSIQAHLIAHLLERACNIAGVSCVRTSTKLSLKDAAILAILGSRSGISSGWTNRIAITVDIQREIGSVVLTGHTLTLRIANTHRKKGRTSSLGLYLFLRLLLHKGCIEDQKPNCDSGLGHDEICCTACSYLLDLETSCFQKPWS